MTVKYYPFQPHCFAFGGFDMQMLNALEAVKKQGVEASKLDIWSRDSHFEILHLWGIGEHNYQLIDWCKKSGKYTVATVLLPYYGTIRSEVGHWYRMLFSRKYKRLLQYYDKLDRVVVVNDVQAEILKKKYYVPASKIDIIPNIVEQKFFESDNIDFKYAATLDRYILCTGNICRRKNQLNLAKACIHLGYNLVLIGKCMDGEDDYAAQLKEIAEGHDNIVWLQELPKASDELVAAYRNCAVFALPSLDETQPISALEATAVKKPLILLDKKYARQTYYEGAILCKSPSVTDIETALKKGMDENTRPGNAPIDDCKEELVGSKYLECYQNVKH